ncbi:MAG TPA: biotin transporter BioY [Acidobacteriaceae bacterium]|nr:biotin transporter BioY [Acidobacteriaceae bacterium]
MNASAATPALPRLQSALLRNTLAIALGSLLVAICAHLSVPLWFTPVPLTLQPFAVILLGLLLAPGTAAAALVLYLAEGALGLPVFTPHGPGGMLQLLGPTGGYLLSYPFAAFLVSWLRRRFTATPFVSSLLAATTGDALILLSGAAWLAVIQPHAITAIFTLSILPFLPGEILKVIAAAGISAASRRVRRS